jgi:hypothetical protein
MCLTSGGSCDAFGYAKHCQWLIGLKGCEVEHPTATVLDECWEYASRQGSGFGWTVGKLESFLM